MKTDYVPREICIDLFDLGFDTPTTAWWWKVNSVSVPTRTCGMDKNWNKFLPKNNGDSKRISAPFWQQAFEWMRKKHGLIGIVDYDEYDDQFMYYLTDMKAKNTINWSNSYPTYEEAQTKCLKKIIEILKTNPDDTK